MARIAAGIRRYGGKNAKPFIIAIDHQTSGNGVYNVDEPLGTITTKARFCLIESFLIKYYGSGNGVASVDEPLPTVTTKDRFALIQVNGDITLRILQPDELARAMSFDNYTFTGTGTEQVKQIGNAVPVRVAEALVRTLIN
ncbi:MAG: C-5 cytosine-specific DNA methylase [Syntrophorhabdus sp. PtaB.Bin184]|nr:MAG: C-5 cytosine-specific DNA methylase [Syntrophorhabdus sp. PtaB.Bin184]